MKSFFFGSALVFLSSVANAQTFNFNQQSKWNDVPEKHSVDTDFAASAAIGILDDRTIDYRVEGKEIALYCSYHKIVRINDDKGIEMYNKIYIPVYPNADISNLKARTILQSGKIIDVPAEKVKEITEEGRTYKLFAMEGVEKGSEVEYNYTIKRNTTFFGTEIFQSGSLPYQKATFTLSVPKHLKFDAKGFNGFKISSDSVMGDQRLIVGYDENIAEVDDEKYAIKEPYLKRVEYKLSYNLSTNPDVRIYTWKEFAKRAYSIYTTINPKEEKPLEALISSIKIDDNKSKEEKILAVENYIKSNINIDKDLIGEDASAIDKIVKRRSSDNQGMLRLFANIFEKIGIDYQMVFVSKRDEIPLDAEIENWNRVDETAFYFPETKKYLSPTSAEYRYPYIPFFWAGTSGLFLKGTTIGTFKSAVGSFGEIAMQPFENNSHDMAVSVKFDASMDTLLINSKQILTGYGAANYRPIYTFLPKEKQDEANLEIVKSITKNAEIKNIKVENAALTNYFDNKPLSITADIKSTDMIERAGNKVLLKIGEIIGPQVQMYQEKPRSLPIELPYPHSFNRKINLEIPTGYTVKNLNDLNMYVLHKDGEERTMGFVSSYKQDGNLVTIDIVEDYRKIKYPLSQFEDFRKVINASADFNKVVLVLEKSTN
jgi:hypothetical protein